MNYPFNVRLNDHDSVMTSLTRQSYTYFRGFPVYYIDDAFKPLAQLCNELKFYNPEDEDARQIFKQAVDKNLLFREFASRFLPAERLYSQDQEFFQKMGDILLNVHNIWHLIELKTSQKKHLQ